MCGVCVSTYVCVCAMSAPPRGGSWAAVPIAGKRWQLLFWTCGVVQFFKAVRLLQACNLRLSVLCFCTRMTSGLNLLSGSRPFSQSISFATWNIRTLIESAGDDRRICRIRPDPK